MTKRSLLLLGILLWGCCSCSNSKEAPVPSPVQAEETPSPASVEVAAPEAVSTWTIRLYSGSSEVQTYHGATEVNTSPQESSFMVDGRKHYWNGTYEIIYERDGDPK